MGEAQNQNGMSVCTNLFSVTQKIYLDFQICFYPLIQKL